MKPSAFDYHYFWHITPILKPNAFGFWRVWFSIFVCDNDPVYDTGD